MKRDAVVVAVCGQADEVVDGAGRLGGVELQHDGAAIGLQRCSVLLRRVDLDVKGFAVTVGHVISR
jgi:hypothetical protein